MVGGGTRGGGPDARHEAARTLKRCSAARLRGHWPRRAAIRDASGRRSQQSVAGVEEAAVLASWRQALNESGYVRGRNVEFEYRFADGQLAIVCRFAAELVRLQVTVLVANTTPPAFAAKAADCTIPVVFVTGIHPVEVGLAKASIDPAKANARRGHVPLQQAGREAAGVVGFARVRKRADRHVGACA